jgi:hypothetical protein
MDSQSAIALSKNPVFHDRSKHIDVRFHFIRECVEDGKLDIEHVRTEEKIADILTKPLARERFCELREKIGVVKISNKTSGLGVKCKFNCIPEFVQSLFSLVLSPAWTIISSRARLCIVGHSMSLFASWLVVLLLAPS